MLAETVNHLQHDWCDREQHLTQNVNKIKYDGQNVLRYHHHSVRSLKVKGPVRRPKECKSTTETKSTVEWHKECKSTTGRS